MWIKRCNFSKSISFYHSGLKAKDEKNSPVNGHMGCSAFCFTTRTTECTRTLSGLGEITCQLRAPTTLAKDWDLVFSTHSGRLTTLCNCSFMRSDALFWFPLTLMSDIKPHTETGTHTHTTFKETNRDKNLVFLFHSTYNSAKSKIKNLTLLLEHTLSKQTAGFHLGVLHVFL